MPGRPVDAKLHLTQMKNQVADSRSDVTRLLQEWSAGNRDALDTVMPVVYAELHRLARAKLRGERADHTLQSAALVNETYLRLVDQTRVQWKNRAHFFGTAAQLMRRILIDHARERRAAKRGGGARRIRIPRPRNLCI